MICTCFTAWDLYDLDFMQNFSISAKRDLDDLDHDLSEVLKTPRTYDVVSSNDA